MIIIDILMYSIGSIFFFSALAFTYYSIQCARIMKGALGRRIMAYAALLFIVAGMIGAIDAFFFPGSGLVYGEFSLSVIALITLVSGGFLVGKTIQRVHGGSLIKHAFIIRRGIYYLIAFLVLILVDLPISILDILRPLSTGFSWYSVVSISLSAFSFVNLAIGAGLDYSAASPSAAAAAAAAAAAGGKEIGLLRDDILAVRTYGAMTNMFLASVKPALSDKPLRDVLTEYFEYNPILFEGCEIKDDGTINMEPIIKNLDRISGENRMQVLCSIFSALNSKIMNLYGAVTSPELAKKRLEESYLFVKKQYGELPIFFDILRTLPEEVLEEERLGLLSREELEARVKERTIELERALEDVRKAKERVEELAKAEKERAEELKDARDVTLSVLEDTDEAKRDLEKAKIEIEKAKTLLEEKVKERTAELEQTYHKLVKTEAAAAAAADKARVEEAEKYTKELQKAYEELKTLDKMKSDFISIAAHELRTPLTPVRAYIELIKAGKLGKIEWRQIEKLSIAEKNIDLLVKLIDDMLDITRIEAGRLDMRKEVLSVGEIIDIALDRVEIRMGKRKHRIGIYIPDSLPPIYGDKELMVKVFDNLLSNAMKYTPGSGKIMVEVREEGKKIHATVTDTGIGISKKDLEKIFERFYVADSSLTRKHRGIGLGLAITKGIVEAHNGKIWAESKGLGNGSIFHVLLPIMGKEK